MRAACRKSVVRWAGRLLRLSVWGAVCALLCPLPIGLQMEDFASLAGEASDSASADKSKEPAFPCQNRPCGCRSAQQCWKKCCCFTNKQKIAWAKEHGVEVPDFVLAAAEKDSGKSNSKATQKSCCDTKSSAPAHKQKSQPRTKTVIAVMAYECQGLYWLLAGVPLVIEPVVPQSGCAEGRVAYTIEIQSDRLPEVPSESMRMPPRIG